MTYLIVLAMVAIALALLWAWWAGRIGRDPTGSVDHFHRALAAMQPGEQGSDTETDPGTDPRTDPGTDARGRGSPRADEGEGRSDPGAVDGGPPADGARHVDTRRSHGPEG